MDLDYTIRDLKKIRFQRSLYSKPCGWAWCEISLLEKPISAISKIQCDESSKQIKSSILRISHDLNLYLF